MGVLRHSEAKKSAKCLIFWPGPKFKSQMEPLCKNWILSNDFFIFEKIFPYQPDFGWFLAKMGGLGHFEAKKCAN